MKTAELFSKPVEAKQEQKQEDRKPTYESSKILQQRIDEHGNLALLISPAKKIDDSPYQYGLSQSGKSCVMFSLPRSTVLAAGIKLYSGLNVSIDIKQLDKSAEEKTETEEQIAVLETMVKRGKLSKQSADKAIQSLRTEQAAAK